MADDPRFDAAPDAPTVAARRPANDATLRDDPAAVPSLSELETVAVAVEVVRRIREGIGRLASGTLTRQTESEARNLAGSVAANVLLAWQVWLASRAGWHQDPLGLFDSVMANDPAARASAQDAKTAMQHRFEEEALVVLQEKQAKSEQADGHVRSGLLSQREGEALRQEYAAVAARFLEDRCLRADSDTRALLERIERAFRSFSGQPDRRTAPMPRPPSGD